MDGTQVPIVDRERLASGHFFHVCPTENPRAPQTWQPFADLTAKIGITPRSAGIINFDLGVISGSAVRQTGGGLGNFPQTHAQLGVDFAWNVNSTAVRVK